MWSSKLSWSSASTTSWDKGQASTLFIWILGWLTRLSVEEPIWGREDVRFEAAARGRLIRELHMQFEVGGKLWLLSSMQFGNDTQHGLTGESWCRAPRLSITESQQRSTSHWNCEVGGKIGNGEEKNACLFLYLLFSAYSFFSVCFHLSGRPTALHALAIVNCPCRCTALYILTCLFWNLTVSRLGKIDVFLLPLRSLSAPLLPHQHLLPVNSRRALTVAASWYSFSGTPVAWLFSWGQEMASYSRLIVDHY